MNPVVKNLLDRIAEVESGGSYTITSNYSKLKPTKPITEMTIAEVRQWQRQNVAAGSASTAVGRYQFMGPTLDETVQQLKLDPNTTKFDEKTQDLLATQLLEVSGLSKWQSGQMSDQAFNDKIAGRWAGWKMSNGKGYHDGDGLNKATGGGLRVLQDIRRLSTEEVRLAPTESASKSLTRNEDEAGHPPLSIEMTPERQAEYDQMQKDLAARDATAPPASVPTSLPPLPGEVAEIPGGPPTSLPDTPPATNVVQPTVAGSSINPSASEWNEPNITSTVDSASLLENHRNVKERANAELLENYRKGWAETYARRHSVQWAPGQGSQQSLLAGPSSRYEAMNAKNFQENRNWAHQEVQFAENVGTGFWSNVSQSHQQEFGIMQVGLEKHLPSWARSPKAQVKDWNAEKSAAMIARFEAETGRKMNSDYVERIKSSETSYDAASYYSLAQQQLVHEKVMQRSGGVAAFFGTALGGATTIHTAPIDIASGRVLLKVGNALLKANRVRKAAESSMAARAALRNAESLEKHSGKLDFLISGATYAGVRGTVDQSYTISDAAFDLGVGGSLAVGVGAAGRGLASVMKGANNVLDSKMAGKLDEDIRDSEEIAVGAKREFDAAVQRYVEQGMDVGQANDLAHAEIMGQPPGSKGIKVDLVPTERTSPALKADLDYVREAVKGVQFTADTIKNLGQRANNLVKKALELDENLVKRAQGAAELEARGIAQDVQVSQRNVADAETTLDKAETEFKVKQENYLKAKADVESIAARGDARETADVSKMRGNVNQAVGKARKAVDNVRKQEARIQSRQAEIDAQRAELARLDETNASPKAKARIQNKLNKLNKGLEADQSRLNEAMESQDNLSLEAEDRAREYQEASERLQENTLEARIGAMEAAEREMLAASDTLSSVRGRVGTAKADLATQQSRQARSQDEHLNLLRQAYSDQLNPNLDLETLAELEASLSPDIIDQLAKQIGVEDLMQENNLSAAIRMKHMTTHNQEIEGKYLLSEQAARKDRQARTGVVRALVAADKRVGQFSTPTSIALLNSLSVTARNWARFLLESPLGGTGKGSASMESVVLNGKYIDSVMSTHQAAWNHFKKGVPEIAVARDGSMRKKFDQLERDVFRAKLKGATDDEILKKTGYYPEELRVHVQNMYDSALAQKVDLWEAKGSVGPKPTTVDEFPVRWNQTAIADVLKTPADRRAFRLAMANSLRTQQTEAIAKGADIDPLSDAEIRVITDRYVNNIIMKSADGSNFGRVSGKDGMFNWHAALVELNQQARMESKNLTEPNAIKKLGALYEKGGVMDRDFTITFKTSDGRTISLDDLSNPSVTEGLMATSRYMAGRIALLRRNIDIENPQSLKEAKRVMEEEGATAKELDMIDSAIAQITGKRYHGQEANKWVELYSSLMRNAMLGGLVFAQMAETANMIGHMGVMEGIRFVGSVPRLAREAKMVANGKALPDGSLLKDFEPSFGQIGTENYRYATFYDMYDNMHPVGPMDVQGERVLDKALRAAKTSEQIMGTISFFRAINAAQRRFTAEVYLKDAAELAMAVKAGGNASELLKTNRYKHLASAGIDERIARGLGETDGVFLYDDDGRFIGTNLGNIADGELHMDFGTSIRRGVGQVIQENFAGEMGLWHHSNAARLFFIFRGFMFNSIGKQMYRQFADFGAMRGTANAVIGSAFAGFIGYVRAHVRAMGEPDDRKRQEKIEKDTSMFQLAMSGIQYSSMMGVVQEFTNVIGWTTGAFESQSRIGPQMGWGVVSPAVEFSNQILRAKVSVIRSASKATGVESVFGEPTSEHKYTDSAKALLAIAPWQNNPAVNAVVGRRLKELQAEESARMKKERRRNNGAISSGQYVPTTDNSNIL